jgi:hypothetical protein
LKNSILNKCRRQPDSTLAASKECEPECLNPSVKLRVLTEGDAKILGLRPRLLVLLFIVYSSIYAESNRVPLSISSTKLPGSSHIHSSAKHFSMLEMDSSISYNDEEHIESASSSSDSVPYPC